MLLLQSTTLVDFNGSPQLFYIRKYTNVSGIFVFVGRTVGRTGERTDGRIRGRTRRAEGRVSERPEGCRRKEWRTDSRMDERADGPHISMKDVHEAFLLRDFDIPFINCLSADTRATLSSKKQKTKRTRKIGRRRRT